MEIREALKKLAEEYQQNPGSERYITATLSLRCYVAIYPDPEKPGFFTVAIDPMPEDNYVNPALTFSSDQSAEIDGILADLAIDEDDEDSEEWSLNEKSEA